MQNEEINQLGQMLIKQLIRLDADKRVNHICPGCERSQTRSRENKDSIRIKCHIYRIKTKEKAQMFTPSSNFTPIIYFLNEEIC